MSFSLLFFFDKSESSMCPSADGLWLLYKTSRCVVNKVFVLSRFQAFLGLSMPQVIFSVVRSSDRVDFIENLLPPRTQPYSPLFRNPAIRSMVWFPKFHSLSCYQNLLNLRLPIMNYGHIRYRQFFLRFFVFQLFVIASSFSISVFHCCLPLTANFSFLPSFKEIASPFWTSPRVL